MTLQPKLESVPSTPVSASTLAANANAKPNQMVRLSRLVQLEWDIRDAADAKTLDFMAVNDLHKVVPYDTAALFRSSKMRVEAISGGVALDRTMPKQVWISKVCKLCMEKFSDVTGRAISSDDLPKKLAREFAQWTNGSALWVPLKTPKGRADGGMLFLRDDAFTDGEIRILARLVEGVYRTRLLFTRMKPRGPGLAPRIRRMLVASGFAILAILSLTPTPAYVLAPASAVAIDPFIVTAPQDGVLAEIALAPDSEVRAGDIIARYAVEDLENAYEVARQKLSVADANYQRAVQQGVLDPDARAEISSLFALRAEVQAELAFATERLRLAVLRAPVDGIVLYSSPEEWRGRPLRLGERILTIADPTNIEIRAKVAVADVSLVEPGASSRFFLSSDPLNPIEARLSDLSFDASVGSEGQTGYDARLELAEGEDADLRLGMTGSVRLDAGTMPFIYQYLRKPLAAARRTLGY
ncbi:MAG: HlyD family efflux transporter periplasmic adaptor subunit [Pseudomonadota bacterium]